MFLRKNIKHVENMDKNRMIDFFANRIIKTDFDEYSPIFIYYMFESIALIIREIKTVIKTNGVYILNKQISKFCECAIIKIHNYNNNDIFKCYVLQILTMVNYHHLLTYDLKWDKLINDDKNIDEDIELRDNDEIKYNKFPTTQVNPNYEFYYLKEKYNFIRVFSHKKGIKYYYQSREINYPINDKIPIPIINHIEFVTKTLYFNKYRKCLFDFLISIINKVYTVGLNDFIKKIIITNINNIKECPTLIILISTYILLKGDDITKEFNKQYINMIKNTLLKNIYFVNGLREFKIIKRALFLLKFDDNQIKEPLVFNFISDKNYFGNMIILKESRIYCIEQNSFN
jgi:hypothetical protein